MWQMHPHLLDSKKETDLTDYGTTAPHIRVHLCRPWRNSNLPVILQLLVLCFYSLYKQTHSGSMQCGCVMLAPDIAGVELFADMSEFMFRNKEC